MNRDPDAYR
ncbi:hypothetical protein RDI58_003396 [Solanum bulbocastanum]|uniref:Uncharacterized protein n=1 Tax=Solanum bulbocastanum TaxID=147425 RepID=A0AAN8UHP4_SOLBU